MTWKERLDRWHADPDYDREFRHAFPTLDIGLEIARRRMAKGWSQADLAREMRSHQPLIARLESGKHPVTTSMLERVAEALGTELRVTFATPSQPAAVAQSVAVADALSVSTGRVTRTITTDQPVAMTRTITGRVSSASLSSRAVPPATRLTAGTVNPMSGGSLRYAAIRPEVPLLLDAGESGFINVGVRSVAGITFGFGLAARHQPVAASDFEVVVDRGGRTIPIRQEDPLAEAPRRPADRARQVAGPR